jgi:hypothetical protein
MKKFLGQLPRLKFVLEMPFHRTHQFQPTSANSAGAAEPESEDADAVLGPTRKQQNG